MPRKKSPQRVAAGQLILVVQKVWHFRMGTDQSDDAFQVMERAHDLVQALDSGTLTALLDGRSVAEYLGALWVACHPSVVAAVSAFERAGREV